LIGIYSKAILPVIESDINERKYQLKAMINKSKLNTLVITEDMDFYREGLFLNINSPEDLSALKKLKP
jgi:molybdopterin-guanine dinucleotide biosynthesis protein A